MRKLVLFIALATPALYSQEETPDHRLRTSTAVLHEIMSAPDKGIPNDLHEDYPTTGRPEPRAHSPAFGQFICAKPGCP